MSQVPCTPNESVQPIQNAHADALVHFGALYWRKRWFGPACPPAILFFRDGRLRFDTRSGVLFDVPISEVQVKLTVFKTLILTADGSHYAVVGTAGVASRGLSAEQMATLRIISAMPNAWPLNSSEPALFAKAERSVGQNHLNFAENGSTIRAISRGTVASATLMQRWASLLTAQGARRIES